MCVAQGGGCPSNVCVTQGGGCLSNLCVTLRGECQSNVCVSQGRGCPFYIMLPLEENVHIMCVLFKRRLSI